ncbi:type IV toxin-antitoxin system AbiEi family antitoxin domain-containing protein [Frankia sp. CNm7]|uniref:Type IV toxin-antitoxin system AbiEi family antitoxin domain-containing protein n=1 Tax=Frankia nepalensis TaxID=1836974 RepID=A0A937RPG6_9ACTN|nr:type IV toxin-antitoxin system AbiEi family antitoxin domain-containing protein [Frankia nepalensis]MBL7500660.1 type IV toxin-antitoxin system AbiEi family antitoxin domain-containing protein [Frankia nepalensis]MBL7515122.1 type IV toxin-antitoxin system AbiEi family antitoxin domain-containing protein [Frankia nepalensis]MBL7522593.1 type IV toxin-antitoxin system AbiEi family antitoxin domain-containing protein [Frankia nepalensis]MBL7632605.1 type IV toxin-antitoxin system AbiEi family 
MLLVGRVARGQSGMITYAQAIEAGLTRQEIRTFVRRGWWERPVRGAYIIRSIADRLAPPDHPDQRARLRPRVLAALATHPDAVVCGITAARLLGFGSVVEAADDEPVHLLIADRGSRRSARGVVLVPRREAPPPDSVVVLSDITMTSAALTLADLVLTAGSREHAVSLMDAALRSGTLADLAAARAASAWRPGCRRVAPWWVLADGRSESVLETRTRLLLLDHDLTPEELQWTVHDDDAGFVARVDLAYPSRRVAVEADGARFHGASARVRLTESGSRPSRTTAGGHSEVPDPLFRDRRRQNALTRLGWKIVRVTWDDVTDRPLQVVDDIRGTLRPHRS